MGRRRRRPRASTPRRGTARPRRRSPRRAPPRSRSPRARRRRPRPSSARRAAGARRARASRRRAPCVSSCGPAGERERQGERREEGRPRRPHAQAARRSSGPLLHARQPHGEGAALAGPAVHLDPPLVQPHDLAHEVEADAGASDPPGDPAVDHVELLEDPLQVLGCDPDPAVLDLQGHLALVGPSAHHHPASRLAVLDGVVDQLAHDLVDQAAVALQRVPVARQVELHAGPSSCWPPRAASPPRPTPPRAGRGPAPAGRPRPRPARCGSRPSACPPGR